MYGERLRVSYCNCKAYVPLLTIEDDASDTGGEDRRCLAKLLLSWNLRNLFFFFSSSSGVSSTVRVAKAPFFLLLVFPFFFFAFRFVGVSQALQDTNANNNG
jgi:hypothetical protein